MSADRHLRFAPEVLRGFALLARTAGLLGHLAEELRSPAGPGLYRQAEHGVSYAPPGESGSAGTT